MHFLPVGQHERSLLLCDDTQFLKHIPRDPRVRRARIDNGPQTGETPTAALSDINGNPEATRW
jgi:hypothetical protein